MFKANTKFLIADDSNIQRKIIKLILNDLGYMNLVEATDGQMALEAIMNSFNTNRPIQFIISDWEMPHMKGIDLLKTCKNHPVYKSIPFILLTAANAAPQIMQALAAEVSEYIVKPFSAETLRDKIDRIYLATHSENIRARLPPQGS